MSTTASIRLLVNIFDILHQYFKLITVEPYLTSIFNCFTRFKEKTAQKTYILLKLLRLPDKTFEYEEFPQTPIIESIDQLERTQNALVRSLSQLIDENDEGIEELLEMVNELKVETKRNNRSSLLLKDYCT